LRDQGDSGACGTAACDALRAPLIVIFPGSARAYPKDDQTWVISCE
jgi:hypothetical protein